MLGVMKVFAVLVWLDGRRGREKGGGISGREKRKYIVKITVPVRKKRWKVIQGERI